MIIKYKYKIVDCISYGFTLVELLITVIIISILVKLVIPNYAKTREKLLDKEAIGSLKMIRSANRQYYMQYGSYYPSSGTVTSIGDINGNLTMDLKNTSWNYSIRYSNANGFIARANRSIINRSWNITRDPSVDPQCVPNTGGECL